MAYTSAQIKNLILMEISHETIADAEFSNPTTTNTDVPILNAKYNLLLPSGLLYHPWTFAKKYATLDLVDNTTADTRWKYMVTLPIDFLGGAYLYQNEQRSFVFPGYEIIGNVLFSNINKLYLAYTANLAEASWPNYYVDWFKTFVAASVNSLLNGDVQREGILRNNETQLFHTAKAIDGKLNPNESLPTNPFIASRGIFGGGSIA